MAYIGQPFTPISVGSNLILDATIIESKIANYAVTSTKMANSGITAATYGGASAVPVIAIDGAGRVTSASNVSISSGATLSVDNATNFDYLVGLANATTGAWTTAYVSNTKLYFNPSTGMLTATDFNSLSDFALKENISEIESPLETIERLCGVEFNWKENGRKASGFIAQEVEHTLPHLVNSTREGMKTVNYQGIIAYLVETVKSLNGRVKELEKKNGL